MELCFTQNLKEEKAALSAAPLRPPPTTHSRFQWFTNNLAQSETKVKMSFNLKIGMYMKLPASIGPVVYR